ncbi:MAG TPA: hypothetical protein DEV81_16035 [Cyanobacteria bacterium UBA11049]|nr:hypothetical protein [Cyanobacteria bacterium UBA11049]
MASALSYSEFSQICTELSQLDPARLFNELFSISINNTGDAASSVASAVLVELEPKYYLSCCDMLVAISESTLDASNREIPFYMLCQFGRWAILEEIEALVNGGSLSKTQIKRISIISYWLNVSSATLVEPIISRWNWELENEEA